MKKTNTANGEFPGHKLRGKARYAKLYHYTSFEAFVKIWLSKSLKFGSIKNVNDVLEYKPRVAVSSIAQAPMMNAYHDIRQQYKQISLTMDYDSYMKGCMSPCMWGYYADRKNGICIELDYDKIVFPKDVLKGPVTYKKLIRNHACLPDDISTINQLHSFIKKNAKVEFFTKHISWKEENEFRIISSEEDYLDISNAISSVNLITYDSDECFFVEKLVGDTVPIKYLHLIDGDGFLLPVMTDTRTVRKQMEEAKKNPHNALNKIFKRADELYEVHKNEPEYPLLMTNFDKQEK